MALIKKRARLSALRLPRSPREIPGNVPVLPGRSLGVLFVLFLGESLLERSSDHDYYSPD